MANLLHLVRLGFAASGLQVQDFFYAGLIENMVAPAQSTIET